jgi:hypothetical protein
VPSCGTNKIKELGLNSRPKINAKISAGNKSGNKSTPLPPLKYWPSFQPCRLAHQKIRSAIAAAHSPAATAAAPRAGKIIQTLFLFITASYEHK